MDKDLLAGHRKRLRERFRKSGLAGFHDYEIVELILTFAIPRRDVKPLAKELLKRFGNNLAALLDAPLEELEAIRGMGPNTAIFIRLLKEVATEYLRVPIIGKNYLNSLQDVLNYCHHSMSGLRDEVFQVIYLNARNEVLNAERIQAGTVDQSVVYPRKVVEATLKHNASALIFTHNHPSGDPTPSEADKKLTQNLVKAMQAIDVSVHDHLVVARDGYFSFRESGLL
ncbi:MAG: DNA repair protein RadC [bacterium]|nr:DNA repair protein RadC [bacterium]